MMTATASRGVFTKTNKGSLEITERAHGLPARLRRALILVDGARDTSAISAMMPGEDMERMLGELQTMGFIQNGAGSASSVRAEPARPAAPTPVAAPVPAPAPVMAATVATPEPVSAEPPAAAAPVASGLDTALIHQVKVLMIESAQQFLGLMAKPLIAEIEAVHDAVSLKTAIARWNISLRQSHKAAQHADQYVLAVKTLVGI
ncbi:hypothetical protein [Silvimonas iriomotensis]|uniref:Uncharacterized protein n=1 Tax=Silvimonas iriomotensis TaxID=449662 RepID=A0ABQ2P8J3_9NEIS|nr:hypothetical protein [Silvimonas iriomotensis]GGP20614.1 hypothetical protein GCM10010970_16090 [Silvimonas iriomotensis]